MTAASVKNKKLDRDERERILILKHRYENRITIARFGKEALDASDYPNAIRKFTEYLSIITEVKDAKDIYSIKVTHFDSRKELTEMLLISHIYFELARVYDAVPKFHEEVKKSLEQFVHFSVNQPYQVVNSEMARKYLKKSLFKHPQDFRNAYEQIYIQSKKCYIVTFCYGDAHPVTQDYRKFKDWLLEFSWGQELVRRYYQISSTAVEKWSNKKWARISARFIVCPTLLLFSKTLLTFIIKK